MNLLFVSALIDACLTIDQNKIGVRTYNFIIGTPVSNCLGGATAIDSEISGSISVADAWSKGLTCGIQYGALDVHANGGWSRTTTRTYSQSITIHVPPAKQVSHSTSKLATDFFNLY